MKQLTLFCLLFVFQIFGAIPDICVHCWYEVPNSKLSSVAQSPKPPGIAGSEGKLIGNGAAFDSRRNRLIVTGGGSISYSGNEVYAFSLDSLKWTRIKNGASVYDNDDLLYAYYRNGKAVPDSQQPRPGFNYDQIDYDSTTDNLYIFGAPFAATHGKTWKNIFQLNLSTLTWSRPTDIRSGMFIGNVSARDPSTGQIWFYGNSSNGWLSSFDPITRTLTDHGNNLTGGWIPLTQTAAIMPTKNQMISVGGGGANYWNLISSGLSPTHTLTTNGCNNLISQTAPGFEWSPVDKMMIGWAGGTKVITMDTAYNCTEVSPSSSNSVTPSAPTLFGTYGRWRYVPKYNIFVVVNSTTGNVFLYRNSPVPVVTPPPPTLPPVVVITSPSQDTIIPGASIVVAYKVDGVAMTKSFNLDRGKNELIVTATNSAGTGADTVYVSQGVQVVGAPTWPLSARLTASNIKATSLTLTWTPAQDDSGVTHYQIYANGALVQRVPASQLTANVVGLFRGTTYKFRVEALDLRENMSVNGPITVATTSNQLPPDPFTVAPQVPYGEVSTMAKMSSFLYKGLNPIQTGLNETVLDPVRTNVVRGQVRGINGNPIPGVTISISNHPEFGSTLTRADGQFDMVINGGGQITVQYSAAGYLDIQRTVSPQWQDFEIIPFVTLIHLDPVVSPFNANASTIQVLKGSVITDSSGTRQPTVLVSPNTGIKITMADGSTTSPTTVHFRATEYTVGPNGPSAMPAALPASSGYTYAVEYSLDEALSVHAKKVEFTRPLYVYLENFIGFSAGTKIPSGSYDRDKNQWIPEIDGRVIQIAGITNGKADLIVDKNNTVATSAHLDSIGITSDERIQIASLYSVGQLVWRLPIGHFSPWDHNCSYSPYTNPNAPYTYWAKSPVPNTPDDPEAARPPKADEHTDKTHCHDGSIIDCQNQALGESILFPGIPSINYRSDRVPSRRWNTLKIPVTGSAGNILPGIITNMSLVIKVAGQTFTYSYSPANNIIQSFEWNGKNAYGQILNGKQPYTYEITYSYAGQYIPAPQLPYYIVASNISGDINNEGTLSWARAGYSSVPGPSYRSAYLKTTKYSGFFGYDNVDDLGPGWTLDGHHQYDPTSGILHLGNGQDIGVSKQLEIAYTQIGDGAMSPVLISKLGTPANKLKSGIITAMDIAPDGSQYIADSTYDLVYRMDKDGIAWPVPELQGLGIIWNDLVVAQDGSLYLTDTKNSRIWKRAVTGEVTVVAGTGNSGYSGDGAQANQAMLNEPSNVVVGPDGSIYIADTKNKRVRKIATDGIIQTMVGGDSSATEIYDGDANKAKIDINWIAIGSDEAIYIVTHAGGRIVQVDITGKMFSYFGNPLTNAADPTSYAKGDEGSVGLAELKCRRLKVLTTKAGGKRFYLTEIELPENFSGYKRKPGIVRVIDENNIINRVAGGGSDEYRSGIPAINCHLADIEAISLDINGNLFVASNIDRPYPPAQSRSRVQKIVNSYHDYTNQGILFPDPNGGLIYSFSPEGRHLKTYNSFTGKSILEFGYDASGKLSSITDAFGNATQIQRGANGFASSIVNPYSQTLNFENDASGNLTAINLPSNESHKFGYNLAGLMESYTTPKNQKHLFTYDEFGRLLKDEDPEGGFKTVLKSDIPGGNRTTIQTAMGRTDTYDLIYNPDMSTTQIDKDEAGLITKTVHPRNGIDTTFYPNGDNVFITRGPEPQLLAPYQKVERKDYTSPTIAGYSVTHTESVAFTDSTNPLSLSLYMAMTGSNYIYRTSIYDNAIRKWTQDLDHIGIVSTFIDSLGRELEKRYPGTEPVKYSYDSRGRLASISQGSGQDNRTTFMNYNLEGYLSEIIDPLNRHQQFFYDLAGRVIRTVRPDGKEILYSYDGDGNVTSITPPGETSHSFEYTSTDLESKYVPPALGTGEYGTGSIYNLDKQLLKISRPDSLAISVKYDSAGRVDSVLSNTRSSKYYYNSQTGKTDSLISSDGVKLGYTHGGPFIKKMNWTGPVSGRVSFTYFFGFSEWAPESQFLNDADEVLTGRNSYDNINLVGRMRFSLPYGPDFPFLSPMKYLYDTAQRLTGSTVINLKDSLVYNSFREVKEYHALSTTDSLYRCLYKRDKLGRITEKTETIQGATHNYAYNYDMAGRLTEVRIDNVLTSTYSYDANGNRLTKVSSAGTDSGSYDAQDRLVKYGNDSYVYGRNGELQKKYSGISFTDYNYDVFGNLLSVSLANGTTIDYIVDGQNRRIGKKVNGVLVQGLLYQNQINPVAELDGNNKVVSRFVYGSKSNVPDQIFKGDSLTYRVISDQVGSVRMVVNAATSAVVQRMDYDEFGNVIYDSNPGFQPFGFAGGLYEPLTKLARFGARDYEASSGRWMSKDPIRFQGGMNHYLYCGGDPVNYVDPKGHELVGAIVGGISGAIDGASAAGQLGGNAWQIAASAAVSGVAGFGLGSLSFSDPISAGLTGAAAAFAADASARAIVCGSFDSNKSSNAAAAGFRGGMVGWGIGKGIGHFFGSENSWVNSGGNAVAGGVGSALFGGE